MRWRSLLRQADACADRMPHLAYLLRIEATALLNGKPRRAWALGNGAVAIIHQQKDSA